MHNLSTQTADSTSQATNHNGTSNNQDVLVNANRIMTLRLFPVIIFVLVMFFFGTVGNLTAIYIYGFKWQKTALRIFLLVLAIMDITNCVVSVPTEIYILTHFIYLPNSQFCTLSRFTTYVTNISSGMIFIAIAIDRYIRTCRPNKKPMSACAAKTACAAAFCIGIIIAGPTLLLYEVMEFTAPHPSNNTWNITSTICGLTTRRSRLLYSRTFIISLWTLFTISVLLLYYFYILIGWIILKNRKHASLKAREADLQTTRAQVEHIILYKEEQLPADRERNTVFEKYNRQSSFSKIRSNVGFCNITLMLLLITSVFIISFLPFLVILTYRHLYGRKIILSFSPSKQIIGNLFFRSYLINNCADPVIYGMCNYRFRTKARQLFCFNIKRSVSLSREKTIAPPSSLE